MAPTDNFANAFVSESFLNGYDIFENFKANPILLREIQCKKRDK